MARGCVPVGLFVAMLVLCGCSSSFQRVDLGDCRIVVLPAEQPVAGSSEWMTSAGMRALLQAIRRDFQSWTVIVDMPPVLTGDDVIAVLPQIDCALLVAAAGKSQRADIEEAARHLTSTDVVRLVINQVPEDVTRYY